MPKKIQNFARSALVKPITINVGRAGAASMNVVQVSFSFSKITHFFSYFRSLLISSFHFRKLNT